MCLHQQLGMDASSALQGVYVLGKSSIAWDKTSTADGRSGQLHTHPPTHLGEVLEQQSLLGQQSDEEVGQSRLQREDGRKGVWQRRLEDLIRMRYTL